MHVSQLTYQAGAYPGFCIGWDASPLQGYPNIAFAGTHLILYNWVERGTVRG